MPLYEITLTASRVVKIHGESLDDASRQAMEGILELDEIEATDGYEVDDPTGYDSLPGEIRSIVDDVEMGKDLTVLGTGQTGDRVYDDGQWRVWRERVGPADGYDGPPVSVEYYDGNRWSDYDPEIHPTN